MKEEGSLTAEVLSAYDLPYPEAPLKVTLSVNTFTLQTGPPLARHKNRNSFRFSAPSSSSTSSSNPSTTMAAIGAARATTSNNSNNNTTTTNNNINDPPPSSTMKVTAPLQSLYPATATIRVLYGSQRPSLVATYDLQQLRIQESKWLILNLSSNTSLGNALIASSSASKPKKKNNDDNENNVGDGDDDEDDDMIPPTIRVKLTLSGPYRPEIATVLHIAHQWFGLMDALEYKTTSTWSQTTHSFITSSKGNILNKLALPATPILATIVVVSPILVGMTVFVLPFLLPIVVAMIVFLLVGVATTSAVYFSTKVGREYIGQLCSPMVESFVSSRTGQRLCYDTGPRPTPVSLARSIVPTSDQMWLRLTVSLLLDLIGSSSYLLPIVGEGFDLAWAPIQTVFIMAMYDATSPNLKYVSFFEEILPFTDIIPSACIGFLAEYIPKLLHAQNPEVAEAVDSLIVHRQRTQTQTQQQQQHQRTATRFMPTTDTKRD